MSDPKVENQKFEDTIDAYINNVAGFMENNVKLLQYLKKERSQLYGALATVMIQEGVNDFVMSPDQITKVREEYSVHFIPSEDQLSAVVELHKHEVSPQVEQAAENTEDEILD